MGACMFSLFKYSEIINPMGLSKASSGTKHILKYCHSANAMMVAQTQCPPVPGAQETLFALHDSLGRLSLLHPPPISLSKFLSFQTNPKTSHSTIWDRKWIFFPHLLAGLVYLLFIPQPFTTCQTLNGLSLLVRRMGWLLWQLEVTLLSKGLFFTFGASLMDFKGLFCRI